MSTHGSPPIDPATAIAVIELTREEVPPHDAPSLSWLLRGLMGFVALIGLLKLVAPGPGEYAIEGWMLLGVASFGALASGPLARLWAWARLRRRAAGVAKSPHRWPGVWYETPRRRAMAFLVVSGLLLFAIARDDGDAEPRRGRRSSRYEAHDTPRERFEHAATGTLIAGSLAAWCGVVGGLAALAHWRFGASRLVPSRPDLEEGAVLSAILEASPRLARAREVTFELHERNYDSEHSSDPFLRKPGVVRATQTVTSDLFESAPGLTLVPMTLPVPIEAHTAGGDGWFGAHVRPPGYVWFEKSRVETQAWDVRVRAEVDGMLCHAVFPFKTITRRVERPSGPAIGVKGPASG